MPHKYRFYGQKEFSPFVGRFTGINQRKEILESINSTIEKTFYRNEDDATQFYSDMMVRKKAHGGKYNEKFLDYQPLETEFEDGEDE